MPSTVRRSLRAALVTIAILIVPSVSSAQPQPFVASADDDGPGGVGVGLKGGPLFARFSSDLPSVGFEDRTGWMLGLFLGGNRPGRVGVAVEINYGKKSTVRNGNEQDFYFIEVPVLVRVNFGSSNRERVAGYVVAGPAVSLNLKVRQGDLDIKSNVETADLEAVIGAGVEITRFIIEGRYIGGLRAINKDLTLGGDITSRAFALLFGVRFN